MLHAFNLMFTLSVFLGIYISKKCATYLSIPNFDKYINVSNLKLEYYSGLILLGISIIAYFLNIRKSKTKHYLILGTLLLIIGCILSGMANKTITKAKDIRAGFLLHC